MTSSERAMKSDFKSPALEVSTSPSLPPSAELLHSSSSTNVDDNSSSISSSDSSSSESDSFNDDLSADGTTENKSNHSQEQEQYVSYGSYITALQTRQTISTSKNESSDLYFTDEEENNALNPHSSPQVQNMSERIGSSPKNDRQSGENNSLQLTQFTDSTSDSTHLPEDNVSVKLTQSTDSNSHSTQPPVVATEVSSLQLDEPKPEIKISSVLDFIESSIVEPIGANTKHSKTNNNEREETPRRLKLQAKLQSTYYIHTQSLKTCTDSLFSLEPPNLICIEGSNGVGKTRFAEEICKFVTSNYSRSNNKQLYVASGSFQNNAMVPYNGWVAACTNFVQQMNASDSVRLSSFRKLLLDSFDESSRTVLTNVVPALRDVFGTRIKGPNKPGSAFDQLGLQHKLLNNFINVFCTFIKTVVSLGDKFVFVLHDYHYADVCSWELLKTLQHETLTAENFTIIVTVDAGLSCSQLQWCDYVSEFLKSVRSLSLTNLNNQETTRLLSELLGSGEYDCSALSNILMYNTRGNLQGIVEFMDYLESSKLIEMTHRKWIWDINDIQIHLSSNEFSTTNYWFSILNKLSSPSREMLRIASCLGTELKKTVLDLIIDEPTQSLLDEAQTVGILTQSLQQGSFAFKHEAALLAVYKSISVEDQEQLHAHIGRKLWRQLSMERLGENLYIILSQLNRGRRYIETDSEKSAIATLCSLAGRKAADSSSFRQAADFLYLGISFLSGDSWRENYDLTLTLYDAAIQCDLCTANYTRVQEAVAIVLSQARSFDHKLNAYLSQAYAYNCSNAEEQAVELILSVLNGLGVTFPFKLCLFRLRLSRTRVNKLLKGKSDEQLLRLPPLTNHKKLEALKFLQLLVSCCVLRRPKLLPFVLLKLMYITLKYGSSVFSSFAFASYGAVCASQLDGVEEGIRFGSLALKFLRKYDAIEYLPRVYALYHGCTYCWKYSFSGSLQPLLQAYNVGLMTGDNEFAALSANIYCIMSLETNKSLYDVMHEWEEFREAMTVRNQKTCLRMFNFFVQSSYVLMERDDPSVDTAFDYDSSVAIAHSSGILLMEAQARLCRLRHACISNYYKYVTDDAMYLIKNELSFPPDLTLFTCSFFSGLGLVEATKRDYRLHRKYRRVIRTILKRLRKWSTVNPENFLSAYSLVMAEYLCVQGRNSLSMQHYITAVATAQKYNSYYILALAQERTARYLLGLDDEKDRALSHFLDTIDSYAKWGAVTKANALRNEVVSLFGKKALSSNSESTQQQATITAT